MATLHTTLHFNTNPLNSSPFLCHFTSNSSKKENNNGFSPQVLNLRCAFSSTPTSTSTSSCQEERSSSRRLVSLSLLFSHLFTFPNHAEGGSLLDKYVKKKKLDPLDAYVPAIILTQFQIKDLEKTLEVDQPQFAASRSLLRSGPAASLRVNIRAVAQYASDAGNGNAAFNDVDQCLRALEELDSLLLHASRNEPDASVKLMKEKIGVAINALDSLLRTVPPDVFNKGKAIADAYRIPYEEADPETLDPELKELESIL